MSLWPDDDKEHVRVFRERSQENKKGRLQKGEEVKEEPRNKVIKRWQEKLDRRNLERDK